MPILETKKLTKMLNLEYLQMKSSDLNEKDDTSRQQNENSSRTEKQDDKSSLKHKQEMLSDS